jgi:OOP family OmpA-OmpF porin
VQDVDAVLSKQKITFTPGSAELDASAGSVMSALASALKGCAAIKIEIAGHTDSQGSDQGNLSLSQARAEAVLLALQGRQVDVSGMIAKGYGETVPIADNGSEAGREANRRIEFTLVSAAAKAAASPQDAVAEAAPVEDDRPSVAPQEMTLRPKARPKDLK